MILEPGECDHVWFNVRNPEGSGLVCEGCGVTMAPRTDALTYREALEAIVQAANHPVTNDAYYMRGIAIGALGG